MYITCGVPQGLVLGPLLFTLYINDIANCTSSTPRLFADDTCLILQHKNLADLNVKINTEIKAIENYMNANKLTLNISKSNVIAINSNSKNNYLTSDLVAGVGNLRPAGRIRPAKQNHPARDILLKYYRIRPTVSSAILDFDEFQQSMRQ